MLFFEEAVGQNYTETEAHTVGTDRGHVAEVEGLCLFYMKYKRFFITRLTTNKRVSQNNSKT